ncbi:hypothetical protein KI387_024508, partial [Taxus chinensis]
QQAVSLALEEEWNKASVAGKRIKGWLKDATGIASIQVPTRTYPYEISEHGTNFLFIFVNQRAVKEALRADVNINWKCWSDAMESRMSTDYMKSTKWKVEMLVKWMSVLVYQ